MSFGVQRFLDRADPCALLVKRDANGERPGVGAIVHPHGDDRTRKTRDGEQGQDQIERDLDRHESALGEAKGKMGRLPQAHKGREKTRRQTKARVPGRLHDAAVMLSAGFERPLDQRVRRSRCGYRARKNAARLRVALTTGLAVALACRSRHAGTRAI